MQQNFTSGIGWSTGYEEKSKENQNENISVKQFGLVAGREGSRWRIYNEKDDATNLFPQLDTYSVFVHHMNRRLQSFAKVR